jgi:hypothetical protein
LFTASSLRIRTKSSLYPTMAGSELSPLIRTYYAAHLASYSAGQQ